MMELYRKYRPRRLRQVVGQERVTRRIEAIIRRRGFDRGAFWLEGPSGTGKTTIAQAVARELGALRGDPGPVSFTYTELDGDRCSVEAVRELDEYVRGAVLWDDRWQVTVVNEAHAMTARAVQAWLTLLEKLPRRWLVIFTTTESLEALGRHAKEERTLFGTFAGPFRSRVIRFKLTNQGLAPRFARLAHRIACREGLNGRPADAYLRLVQECRNNMREVPQRIEAGEMLG